MDKVVTLFCEKLDSMLNIYKKKISSLQHWQLDNAVPNELRSRNTEQKVDFLLDKYKNGNPIYLLLRDDKNLLEKKANSFSFQELKSLNVDPRFLEGNGFNEKQIEDFYKFTEQVRALL